MRHTLSYVSYRGTQPVTRLIGCLILLSVPVGIAGCAGVEKPFQACKYGVKEVRYESESEHVESFACLSGETPRK